MSAPQWSDDFLDQLRKRGDSLADRTVEYIFENHGIDAVNSLWDVLLKNDQIPPAGQPQKVYDYLEHSGKLPEWANQELIIRGEEFFMRNGIFCLLSLLCASLPECYVMKKGAQVLGSTQNLGEHSVRRLFETAQLVVAVMAPGGLGQKGAGVRAIQKVRLMHAAIRYLLLRPPPKSAPGEPNNFAEVLLHMSWDVNELGYPINQEDMAYTLLTFSYVILRSLGRLGIRISDDDRKAYLHVWKVAGFLMGVDERLLANDHADAEDLFLMIKERQQGVSEDGRRLIRSLDGAVARIFSGSTKGMVAKWMLKPVPAVIMRQLLEEQSVEILGIRRLTFREWVGVKVLRIAEAFATAIYDFVIGSLGNKFGEMIVLYLTRLKRGWNRQLFHLPDKLRIRWRIDSTTNS